MTSAGEAAWRRRFRAARLSLPTWARDAPHHLTYSSNASGKWEAYAWDRQTDQHRQVTDRPEGTRGAAADPGGDWVWWFDDERGNEFGRWIVEPFAGGERHLAAPQLPRAFFAGLALGRSSAIIGLSDDRGVAVHVVRDGQASRQLYAHREDATVAGISRDDSLFCLSHAEHGDSRHPALRVIDLEGRAVADLWDGKGRGLWAGEWSPLAGDQRLIVMHERMDMPRPAVWNIATAEFTELEISLPGEVSASWYPDASALLLVHEYRGRDELFRYHLASRTIQRLEVEPGSTFGARVRPNGELWYQWTSAAIPPEVRADQQVLLRPPGEPAPKGVPYTDHHVDGIHVFVAEPIGPRPHPAIFQVHGGPTANDSDAFSPSVQAWVDHGFAVLLVNYRGSSGYGKAWRDALEGNPGLTELEDIAKVHEWAVASRLIDPSRTVLAGGSWGGYVTLLGLGTQPERWALGIAAVPVADYIAAYEDEMEPLKAFDRSLFGGTPAKIPDFYRERSPITHVERVRAPVLILAGENDPRCPIRQIDNYVTRLRELGKSHDVYRYDAGHGSLVIEETIRQMHAQIAFVAKHLGTTPPL